MVGKREKKKHEEKVIMYTPVLSSYCLDGCSEVKSESLELQKKFFHIGNRGSSTWIIFCYFPSHSRRKLDQDQNNLEL